jgi:hypothetical protein
MNANLIWPVVATLGLGLLGLGLAYGMSRSSGPRIADAAADAGAKTPPRRAAHKAQQGPAAPPARGAG